MKRSFWIRANRQDLSATKTPTACDIAWSAGIFEGEGTIRLCGRGKRGLALAVPQKDPELLYRLRDLFGGSVSGPCPSNPCSTWNCCGDRARIFSALIYKFLTTRRKSQVDVTGALEYLGADNSADLTVEQLQDRLISFNESKSVDTWRGSNRSSIRKANYEARKAADPNYLPELIRKNKENRDKREKIVSIA